jgi:hypothetical protein
MKIKHRLHRQHNGGSATEAAPQETNGHDVETAGSAIGESEIAALAYHYWQERGRPDGCPEEDWLRAERDLAGTMNQDK